MCCAPLPIGALAVHCKAGLGRTGVLICSYMIKHHGFTAEEAIGYIRICRPGSVIGLQQNYLIQMHSKLVREGQLYRQQLKSQVRSGLHLVQGMNVALRHCSAFTRGPRDPHCIASTDGQQRGWHKTTSLSSHL